VFAAVQVGDRVQIVYQPVLVAPTADGVLLEAHPDAYRRARGPATEVVRQAVGTRTLDWARVDRILRAREGILHRVGSDSGAGVAADSGAVTFTGK
jgi:hypothetical protein